MKTLNFKIVSVFLVFILMSGFIGCKKDATSTSRKDLLTSHNWKMSAEKISGVAQTIEDCAKDNFLAFAANGTYTANPGTIKCDSGETILNGTWTLSRDEKSLTVTMMGDTTVLTIIEFTESKMVLSENDGTDVWEETFVPA